MSARLIEFLDGTKECVYGDEANWFANMLSERLGEEVRMMFEELMDGRIDRSDDYQALFECIEDIYYNAKTAKNLMEELQEMLDK